MTKTAKTKPVKQPASLDDILNEGMGEAPLSALQVTERFANSLKNGKSESGGNDNNKDLVSVSINVLRNFSNRPFSRNDFFLMAAHLALSLEAMTGYFEKWIAALNAAKTIHITSVKDSCYLYELYQIV